MSWFRFCVRDTRPGGRRSCLFQKPEGARMGSVVKKRRKKIRKHKYKKLRKKMRHQRK
jgi:hypothetical protein